MAIRDPNSHKMQIINHPSDTDEHGKSHERAIANVLGIKLTK